MNYLLDTHAIIWMFENSSKMSYSIKEIIRNPQNSITICTISIWEIAIKMNIGKLNLSLSLNELIKALKFSDFDFLQIEDKYILGLSKLPMLHKDPFDRLLIATAIAENMTIITIDENIQRYDVAWVW